MPNIERRRFKRAKVNLTVIYEVFKPISVSMEIGGRTVDALMLDLGKGGMGISTNYDIPVSAILNIKFTLINRKADKANQIKTMEVAGEVRSNILLDNNEHRLGICFTRIKEEDAEAIERFVEDISREP